MKVYEHKTNFFFSTPADNLQALFDLDIKKMLTTSDGRALASDLVVATIGKYGASGSHTSFNVVSHELQKRCSSYFGANEILFFQVEIQNIIYYIPGILTRIIIGYGTPRTFYMCRDRLR